MSDELMITAGPAVGKVSEGDSVMILRNGVVSEVRPILAPMTVWDQPPTNEKLESRKTVTDDIERLKEIKEAASPPVRRLSGGDAGVIIGLLAFILLWVGGWIWGFVATDSNFEHLKWYEALFVLLIVAGPPLWASNMIKHIIGKDD